MPPPVDPSQDYLLTEQPEDITFYYQTAEGVFNPQIGALVHYAKGFSIDRATAASDADLWRNGRVFQLWRIPWQQAGLKDPPKPKDRLVDKYGVAWRVEKAEILSFGQRFRLTCLREVQ